MAKPVNEFTALYGTKTEETPSFEEPLLSTKLGEIGFNNDPLPATAQQSQERAQEAGAFLNNREALTKAAAAESQGNLFSNEEVVKDAREMDIVTFKRKYGEEAAKNRYKRSLASSDYFLQENQRRSTGETIGDSLKSIGSAAIQGASSLASLTGGAVDQGINNVIAPAQNQIVDWVGGPDSMKLQSSFGPDISSAGNKITESIRDTRSEAIKREEIATNIKRNLNAEDSEIKYQEDLDDVGELRAGFRKFGRDFTSEANLVLSNPTITGDVVSSAIGSLITSGGIIGKAAKAAAGTRYAAGAVPTMVGLTEAGGVYDQTVQKILSYEPEQLMNSPEYIQAIESGASHEEARKQVANVAGIQAAYTQLPVATIMGMLVSKFEAAPFAQTGLKETGKNLASQTVEETLQSGSGEFSSNLGVQKVVDAEQDLLEGVGGAAAQGAVGGFGMVGVTQVPNVAARGTAAVGKATIDLADKAISRRLKNLDLKRRDGSVFSAEETSAIKSKIQDGIDKVTFELVSSGNPEDMDYGMKVKDIFEFSPEEQSEFPEDLAPFSIVEEEDGQPTPLNARIDRLNNLMNSLLDPETKMTEDQQNDAALYLLEKIKEQQEFVANPLPEHITKRPNDDAVRTGVEDLRDALGALMSIPEYGEAVQRAMNVDSSATENSEPLTEVTKPVFDRQNRQITANLDKVDLDRLKFILAQDTDGTKPLTKEQRRKLNAAVQVKESVSNVLEEKSKILEEATEESTDDDIDISDLIDEGDDFGDFNDAPTKGEANKVRQEILKTSISIGTEGREYNDPDNAGVKKKLPSVTHYANDIINSMDKGGAPVLDINGESKDAQKSIEGLKDLAEHMISKVEAINKSATQHNGDGTAVPYRSKTPYGWMTAKNPRAAKAFFNKKSNNSRILAKTALIDAYAVIDNYHNLLDLYPELKGERFIKPVLDQSITGVSAAEVQTAEEKSKIEADNVALKEQLAEAENKLKEAEQAAIDKEVADELAAEETKNETKAEPVEQETKAEEKPKPTVEATEAKPTEQPLKEEKVEIPEDGNLSEEDAFVAAEQAQDTKKEEEAKEQSEAEVIASEETPNPDLYESGDKEEGYVQRFQRAFKIQAGKSLLTKFASPLDSFVEYIADFKNLKMLNGKDLDYIVDADRSKQVQDIFKDIPVIINKLNKRLNDPNITIGSDTVIDAMSKKDVGRYRNGKASNLVDTKTGKYDQKLIEQAVLAYMHFLLMSSQPGGISVEQAAKMFNLKENHPMIPEIMEFANFGSDINQTKAQLGQMIMKFWGAQADNDVTMSDGVGIPESLAAELLAISDGVFIEIKDFNLPNTQVSNDNVFNEETDGFDYKLTKRRSVKLRTEKIDKLIEDLGAAHTIIGDTVVLEREVEHFIGEPSKKVQTKQRKNKNTDLSEFEQNALKKMQEIPKRRNKRFIAFIKAFGEDAFVKSLGWKDDNEAITNKQDLVSIRGKNNNLKNGFLETLALDQKIQEYAEKNNLDPNEVKVFWEYYVTKVGRHGQDGFGGQNDKTARGSFVATTAVLDLLNNEQHRDAFWLTIAQASGLVKTHKVHKADAINTIQSKIYEMYPQSLASFRQWMERAESNPDEVMTLAERNTILAEIEENNADNEASVTLFQSLESVARYDYLFETDQAALADFEHNVSLEADGVTDGPMNAMKHYIVGAFSEFQLQMFGKGGQFFNRIGMTYADYTEEDSADIYEVIATKFKFFLVDWHNKIEDRKDLQRFVPVKDAMMRLQKNFGQISYKDGELVIGRGVVKNPVTVSVYGSSLNGITGKITKALMDSVYAELTNELRGEGTIRKNYPEMEADLALLLGSSIRYSKTKGEYYWKDQRSASMKLSEFDDKAKIEFKLYPINIAHLNNNVKYLFAEPMKAAIDSTMSDTIETTETLVKATAIQSAVAKVKFNSMVEAELKRQREEKIIGKADFLSQNSLDKIFEELKKFQAIIENDEQALNVGAPEGDDSKWGLSSDYTDQMRSNSQLNAPSMAGVRISPFLTIGRGDAMMMNIYYNRIDASLRTEPVFDGLETSALEMEEESRKINESVHEGWQRNPLRDVANSFTSFVRNDPFDGMSGIEMGEVVELIRAEDVSVLSLPDYMEQIEANLEELAIQADARKYAESQFTYSTDHMASAGAPHVYQGGEIVLGADGGPATMQEVADAMNLVRIKKLDELRAAKSVSVEKTNKKFKALIEKFGEKADEVVKMGTSNFIEMLDSAELTKETRSVFDAVKKNLPQDVTYVFGSQSNLTKYRNENFPERRNEKAITAGQIDPLNKVVYVVNQSGETALHEAIHAATIGKVLDYYTNQYALSETEIDAVKRLEALMNDFFVEKNFKSADDATQAAVNAAREAIAGHLKTGTKLGKASALNEFMAWSLSNQRLIDAAKAERNTNPLAKLGKKAIALMKRLLGDVKGDVFNNILFNTQVLLQRENNSSFTYPAHLLLNQAEGVQDNPRLADVLARWSNKVTKALEAKEGEDVFETTARSVKFGESISLSQSLIDVMTTGGFVFDMQKKQTFNLIVASLEAHLELDPLAMVRLQKIHSVIIKQLTVDDFLEDWENPQNATQQEKLDALKKLNAITNISKEVTSDKTGKTTQLAGLLALSQTDDQFRSILERVDVPKSLKIDKSSVNNFLDSAADGILDSMSISIRKEGNKNKNTLQVLDKLSKTLAEIEDNSQVYIEAQTNNLLSKADKRVSTFLTGVGDKIGDYSDRRASETTNAVKKGLFKTVGVMSSIISANQGEALGNTVISLSNSTKLPSIIRDQIVDIIGRTAENKDIVDMVNKVRSAVSAARQAFRDELPRVIQNHFEKKPDEKLLKTLYQTIGKTDVVSLTGSFSMDQIMDFFTDARSLSTTIEAKEAELRTKAPREYSEYLRKSKQLANYMLTGKPGDNLLANAKAVSLLLNERRQVRESSDELVQLIDELTSLYAVNQLDPQEKARTAEVIQEDKAGIEFMSYYLLALRNDEYAKDTSAIVAHNQIKGFIPTEAQDGVKLIVADDSNYSALIKSGYIRKGDYKGYGQSVDRGRKGYYYSAVSGKNTYSQGVMQTVQRSVNGIDPRNGKLVNGDGAGIIKTTDMDALVREVKTKYGTNESEALRPIFDAEGNVYAYERLMDPEKLKLLNRNTDISTMMGAWAGRQTEENIAIGFNHVLVQNMKKMYDKDVSNSRSSEYVNIADPEQKDSIYRDTWGVVPVEMRRHIESVFGKNKFYVRRDMVNNALGYRAASIADVFTENTRIPSSIAKGVVQTSTVIFGDKAYKYLVTGEKGIQTAVSTAKNTVIIRSIFVPAVNMASNVFQLLARGVPLSVVAKGLRVKLVEIDTYNKNLKRGIELDAMIKASPDDSIRVRKLKAEKKALEDATKALSIFPLLEAGEFTTIAEGLTDVDEALTNNKFVDWVEGQVDKLPDGLKTAGQYALVSRQTSLYKGMARAIQYGDFLGKAILYDQLTKVEKMDPKEAMGKISEEYVNFNLNAGRGRDYAESMGLTWFWKFKIRSMKVGLRMMRENPVRAFLMMNAGPLLPDLGIGSPITDNFVSVAADGRLDYSVGWGMLFRAPSLNPWLNLMD